MTTVMLICEVIIGLIGGLFLPEELFRSECGRVRLVCRGGAAPERVTDGEHAEAAEGVQREQDEDGERDQGVHHL